MRVNEIMSDAPKTVTSSTSAETAWEMMQGAGIHHLIVKNGGEIAGVLSARDAGGPHGGWLREHSTVGQLMSEEVVTVDPDTTLKRAANMLRGRSIGCLVVVRDGKPIGIVTTADLLELLGRGAIRPNPVSKRAPLNYRAPHKKRHRAYGVW